MSAPVIGFDLDMTLVDARDGILATYRALSEDTGVYVDAELVVTRLGPPLRAEIANWFPAERVEEAVRRYREIYGRHLDRCRLMPGAAAAVAAVRDRGGRVLVVTSKLARFAQVHLDHLGLTVDEVAGDRFGADKAAAITEHGASAYVGDHAADMVAARTAGVAGVGVPTGPCGPDELRAAGATAVLTGLAEFPAWLESQLAPSQRAQDAANAGDVGRAARLAPGPR